jgi:hypothetical protein
MPRKPLGKPPAGPADKHALMRAQPALTLPDIESFTTDELLAARVQIGMARAGGTMIQGRILESRIARLLHAEFPALGTSPWDLRLRDGTLIEVRSGAKTFALSDGKQVDLWIFVSKDEPVTYFVADWSEVAALRRQNRNLALADAHRALRAVEESELADTVRALSRELRDPS